MVIISHLSGGYDDSNIGNIQNTYDVDSYKGLDSLSDDLKKFDPFYMACSMFGEVRGISFNDALHHRNSKLDNLYSPSELRQEYQKATKEGLLRFVDECVPTLNGMVTGIYFPTERILDPVLTKK